MYALNFFIVFFTGSVELPDGIMYILMIPVYWFIFAQGAKRCHDRGNSGWYQIIPFYVLWMLFAEGDTGENNYGDDPKEKTENGFNFKKTESDYKSNEIKSEEIVVEANEPKNKNDRFMPHQIWDIIKEETIENEVPKTTFVPKKKPIRKSQS